MNKALCDSNFGDFLCEKEKWGIICTNGHIELSAHGMYLLADMMFWIGRRKKMESDFFDLYDSQSYFALEIRHNSVSDWCIFIYDRKGKKLSECDKPTISIQSTSRKEAFAKAYVQFTDYLSKNRGGY